MTDHPINADEMGTFENDVDTTINKKVSLGDELGTIYNLGSYDPVEAPLNGYITFIFPNREVDANDPLYVISDTPKPIVPGVTASNPNASKSQTELG